MTFEIPSGFKEGCVAVRVGDRIYDFWNYCLENGYGSEAQIKFRGFDEIDFDEYINRFGHHLCVAFNYCNDGWLGFDKDTYCVNSGLVIVDLIETTPSCKDILELL